MPAILRGHLKNGACPQIQPRSCHEIQPLACRRDAATVRRGANGMSLLLVPITLKEANEFVKNFHRHNRPVHRNGGKFALAVSDGSQLCGVAIVGRPLARLLDNGWTAEVLRSCVAPWSPRNANSMLYGAAWRAWRAMGGRRLVTYT